VRGAPRRAAALVHDTPQLCSTMCKAGKPPLCGHFEIWPQKRCGRSASTDGSRSSATGAVPWRLLPACACLQRRAPQGAVRRARRASSVCNAPDSTRCTRGRRAVRLAQLVHRRGDAADAVRQRRADVLPAAHAAQRAVRPRRGARRAARLVHRRHQPCARAGARAARLRVPAILVSTAGKQGWRALLGLPPPPGGRSGERLRALPGSAATACTGAGEGSAGQRCTARSGQ